MRKSTTTNQYFGEREENAVVNYIRSDSASEKNDIYNVILREPFKKMVQSILRKYPIHIGNYAIEEVEENVLTHLIEHMIKFNPDKITKSGKKTKAFSYCQTIVRNYYKDHSYKSYNEKKTNLCFDEYLEEVENNSDYHYIEDKLDTHVTLDKLIYDVISDIDEKIETDTTIKRNEVIVGDAIINVLRNWDVLFIEDSPHGKYEKKLTNKFAKNKVLLFLKEQTGLSTKEIRLAIKPFREIYFGKKTNLFDDE